MSAPCETWNVNAADLLQQFVRPQTLDISVTFGGIASPPEDDYSDVLAAPESVQSVLDHLDEPTTSG